MHSKQSLACMHTFVLKEYNADHLKTKVWLNELLWKCFREMASDKVRLENSKPFHCVCFHTSKRDRLEKLNAHHCAKFLLNTTLISWIKFMMSFTVLILRGKNACPHTFVLKKYNADHVNTKVSLYLSLTHLQMWGTVWVYLEWDILCLPGQVSGRP